MQSRIKPIARQKRLMCAFVDNAPRIHDNNLIGVPHGREPMCDHNRCASLGEPFQRVLHHSF
jgi:hypothetical protein